MRVNELTEALVKKYESEKQGRKEKLQESLNEAKVQGERKLKLAANKGKQFIKDNVGTFAYCYGVKYKDGNIKIGAPLFIASSYDDYQKKVKSYCAGKPEKDFEFYTVYSRNKNESINVGKIKQMLRRLNEGEISPEDKHDSDLLRSVLAKTGKRSNAKLTKEEQAVLAKYGLERSGYGGGDAALVGRESGSGKINKFVTNFQEPNLDKQNLANKFREQPKRQNNRYLQGIANAHNLSFQDAERELQARTMRVPYEDMENALDSKKRHQDRLKGIDDEYDERRARLQARIDHLEDERTIAKDYNTDGLQAAQSKIDDLLKRKKNESLIFSLRDVGPEEWGEDFESVKKLDGQEIISLRKALEGYYDIVFKDGTELSAVSDYHILNESRSKKLHEGMGPDTKVTQVSFDIAYTDSTGIDDFIEYIMEISDWTDYDIYPLGCSNDYDMTEIYKKHDPELFEE